MPKDLTRQQFQRALKRGGFEAVQPSFDCLHYRHPNINLGQQFLGGKTAFDARGYKRLDRRATIANLHAILKRVRGGRIALRNRTKRGTQ